MTPTAKSEPLMVDVRSATLAHHDLVALVQATTFGTDGLRYQRLDVQSQLDRFNDPLYFHALAGNKLVGVYILDRRQLQVGDQLMYGYYRGVLAVADRCQGRGVGKALTRAAGRWLDAKADDGSVLTYGCIDQDNERSLKLLASGGATVGSSLSMYMMYRQWPGVSCEIKPMINNHHDQIRSLASDLYEKCHVRDFSPSVLPGYVMQDEAGVVISARVVDTAFRIKAMSGMASWCTRLFVTPFAAARKRFNPECFRYVCFSEIVIRPGSESQWSDFVSTVLATHQCHFGVVYVDPQSELFARMQKSRFINRWLHSSTGSIRVVWQVFGRGTAAGMQLTNVELPLHVWPIDA